MGTLNGNYKILWKWFLLALVVASSEVSNITTISKAFSCLERHCPAEKDKYTKKTAKEFLTVIYNLIEEKSYLLDQNLSFMEWVSIINAFLERSTSQRQKNMSRI